MAHSTCTSILLLAANAGCVAALSYSERPLVRNAKRAPTETHPELHSTHSVYQLHENSSQSLHQVSAPSRPQPRKDVARRSFMKKVHEAVTGTSNTEPSYPEFGLNREDSRESSDQAAEAEASTLQAKPELLQSRLGLRAAVVKSPLMRREKKRHAVSLNTKYPEVRHGEPNSTDNKTDNTTAESWEWQDVQKALQFPTAQVFVSLFTTLTIMCIFSTIKSWIYSPIPWYATSDRLKVVLHETKEKLEKLNVTYQERLPELQSAAAEGDEALLAQQERQRAADAQHRAKNEEIHEAAASVAGVPEKLEAAADRCQDAFKEAVNNSTERLEDISKREGREVYAQLQQAIEERKCPDWKPPDWMAGDEDEEMIDMPPLGNLVRGALAPAQLDRMLNDCEWSVMFDIICLFISFVVFVVDVEKPCIDSSPFDWLYGLVVATSFDLMCRLVIIRWCYFARGEMKANRAALEKENEVKTGNELLDTLDSMRRASGAYFDGYFRFNEIVDSWLYAMVRLTSVFFLFWGGFGLYLSEHNILEDTLTCEQHLMMMWLHAYSFLWGLFLTWNLLSACAWLFGNLFGNAYFSAPIIHLAKSFDDSTFQGFPICLSLVESFVLKNSASQIAMLQLEVKQDLADIEIQIQKQQRLQSMRLRSRDRLAELVAVNGSEREFMERSERRVRTTLDQAKPFVGLLAANVRTSTSTQANKARNADRANTGASSTRQSMKSIQEASSEESEDPNEIAAPDVESM